MISVSRAVDSANCSIGKQTASSSVAAATLLLAVCFPIEQLAESTARLTLIIFAFVNAALIKMKIDRVSAPPEAFIVRPWVPVAGLATSLALLLAEFVYG